MDELAKQGITILMVSSDMEEVLGMSDRVVVMHERKIRGILSAPNSARNAIGLLMTGHDTGCPRGYNHRRCTGALAEVRHRFASPTAQHASIARRIGNRRIGLASMSHLQT